MPYVRFAHSRIRTICDNGDRITESAKSVNEVFVWQDYHSPTRMNRTKNYDCEHLTFLLHSK